MLEDPTFWTDEANSPLVSRTFEAFPQEQIPDVVRRVQSWVDLLPGAQGAAIDISRSAQCTDPAMIRMFTKDADRTFISKDNPEVQARTELRQQQQVENLKLVFTEVLDYHQGLGFLVAFLQLFLPIEELVKIVVALHHSDRHAVGYYKSEPQSFVSDAQVLKRLLEEDQPSVAQHLSKLGVLCELYSARWFIGLAVHVLPLRCLLDYWEAYFQYGYEFVFSFGLEFIREFSSELLVETTTAGVMTILRMEDPHAEWKFPPQLRQGLFERFENLLARAVEAIAKDALCGAERLEGLRREESASVLKRVEEARRRLQELEDDDDDGITFSDED